MAMDPKWLCLFVLSNCVFRGFSGVTSPGNIVKTASDKEVRFLWNTTGTKIDEAKWGLFDGTTVAPFFIRVSTLLAKEQKSPDFNDNTSTAFPYKNRVHFIGNIGAGQAWFVLTNLSTADTKEYAAVIKESGGGFTVYPVNLTVLPAPTTAAPTATEAGRKTEKRIQLKFPKDKYVRDELSDPNSQLYQSYVTKIKNLASDVFNSKFVSVGDFMFVKGSVIVIFNLTLIGVDDPLAVLKEAVVKNNGTLHGLTIDPDSIKEGPYVSSTTAQTPSNTPKPGGLKAGEIVGIVFGVVAVIVIAIIVVYFVKKKKDKKKGLRIPMS